MAEKLLSDVLEMQVEEEPLVPIEVDPVLLMLDEQIKKEDNNCPLHKGHFWMISTVCKRQRDSNWHM